VSTSPFFYGRRIVYVNGVKLPSFVLLCTSRDQPRVRDRVHSVLPDKSSAMVTGRTKIFARRPRSSRGAAPPRPFVRRLTLHLLDPSSTMAAQPRPAHRDLCSRQLRALLREAGVHPLSLMALRPVEYFAVMEAADGVDISLGVSTGRS
jgi:hypothetical protein